MSEEEIPLSQHDQLAMAIAQGKSTAGWARQNKRFVWNPWSGPCTAMFTPKAGVMWFDSRGQLTLRDVRACVKGFWPRAPRRRGFLA
jgi:hypothetical protein